jgi:hypothetical protein
MADHEDVNRTIEDEKDLWASDVNDWTDEPVGGGPVMGIFAEYLVSDQFAMGAEFGLLSGSGGYDWHVLEYGDAAWFEVDTDVSYDVSGKVASLYGVYRMPLGASSAKLRLGAGIGYVFGAELAVDFAMHMQLGGSGGRQDSTFLYQSEIEASGSGLSYYGSVGVEYPVYDRLLLFASASYRMTGVDEIAVDGEVSTLNGAAYPDLWDLEEGEPLLWYRGEDGTYFSTEKGKAIGLDFGGPQVTLGLAYAF